MLSQMDDFEPFGKGARQVAAANAEKMKNLRRKPKRGAFKEGQQRKSCDELKERKRAK